MKGLGLLLGGVAMLAACATPPSNGGPAPPSSLQSGSLPAPVPAEAAIRLTAEDAGKAIEARIGQTISVALVGTPTAGYVWSVAEKPAFLGDAVESGGPTVAAQKQPGYAGGNHWEVFAFAVNAAGEGVLRLEQRRPWENSEPPSQTFVVSLKAVAP